ncbi:HD domain-containing phosphohydrolase [Helicovermis profundi]|uniref:HD family phosphohydrolase n=1 Tax=Helicovermis profundi TaxID=3065157 RepID=A0AAU9E3G1_9FIRM|nr:HD family phosphohydrolase [Clostridia bacterium S502]
MNTNNCDYYEKMVDRLTDVGVKLSAEKNIDKLLELILLESMDITSCDAGSIYIVKEEPAKKMLVFKYTKNYSKEFPFKEFEMNIDKNSIAGACAVTKKIYNFKKMSEVEKKLGFKHNTSFDKSYGYSTKNMLVLPLLNFKNDVIGVMQLINKKNDSSIKFVSDSDYENHVTAFLESEEKIISSLSSQAAILIERSELFIELNDLLESSIKTLTTALDQRDPITAGHSNRVAKYALNLAKGVNADNSGFYKDMFFSEDELKELYIAGLLHDVGKIGVKEYVLMKRDKLNSPEIEAIRSRFKYIKIMIELKEIKNIDSEPSAKLDYEIEIKNKIDFYVEKLEKINKCGFLTNDLKEILNEINGLEIEDLNGEKIILLSEYEFKNLSIQKGNLTNSERKMINDHATFTNEILKRITWSRDLLKVPMIASNHHEKLNGKGYPKGLSAENLEIRSRILAVADIFDALTAKDRPYKPAIPIPKSLSILHEEADRNNIDKNLVNLFDDFELYKS